MAKTSSYSNNKLDINIAHNLVQHGSTKRVEENQQFIKEM